MRDLSPGVEAAVAGAVVRPVVFYEGEYATGTVRLWSGVGPFEWDGKTWVGLGQMLGIGAVEETSEIRATPFYVSLSGDAEEILSVNLGAARNGLPGRVWLGFFDDAGDLVVDPFLCFEGRFDVPDIVDEGERATIQVRYESRLIDLDRPRVRRYTHEDQQISEPGDLGYAFVPAIQDLELFWGRITAGQANARRAILEAEAAARYAAAAQEVSGP